MKKSVIVTIAVGLIVVAGSILWKMTRPPTPAGTIPVGAVIPLSGPAAFLGEGMLNGLKLGETHANEGVWGTLPFKIKVMAEDGGANPKTSISAYRKLIDVEKTRVVITTVSGVSMALKPLAEQDGVLLFANASHPAVTTDAKFTLRHSQTAGQEARAMIALIVEQNVRKGVVLIFENDDYGSAFARELRLGFEQAHVNILQELSYDRGTADARVLAQKAIDARPDVMMVIGVGKDLGLVIRRAREFGFTGQIYAGLGFVLVPGAVEAAGEYAAGIIHTEFDFATGDAAYARVAVDYKARFGRDIDASGLIAYNTLKLFCAAADRSPLDPRAVADRIRAMREFQGAAERMSIDSAGNILPAIRLVPYKK